MSQFICPSCHKDDAVQKLTGVTTIKPPPEPYKYEKSNEPRPPDFEEGTWGILVNIFLILIVGVVIGLTIESVRESENNNTTPLFCLVAWCIFILYQILTRILMFTRRYVSFLKEDKIFSNNLKTYRLNVKNYPKQVSRWQMAVTKYNQAFYCRRCDAIYLPGGSKYIQRDKMNELIDYL